MGKQLQIQPWAHKQPKGYSWGRSPPATAVCTSRQVRKDFIYSASTGCYYFYFLYEELRTGMRANGGEKWRQFQLIISPSDILMHYYNYSRMSSKDHHTSFFRLHFSPSKNLTSNLFEKFGSLKGQYLFISLTLWKQGYYIHIRCAVLQGPLFISLYLHWFELFPASVSYSLPNDLLQFCIFRNWLKIWQEKT